VTAAEAEDEALLLMHWELGADERGNLAPAGGAGAIDEGAASHSRAGLERDRRDALALALDARHLAFAIDGAERARLAAEGLKQAPAVEPAFAASPPGAESDPLEIEPGEAFGKRG